MLMKYYVLIIIRIHNDLKISQDFIYSIKEVNI